MADTQVNVGLGFSSMLTLVFVCAKVFGFVDWPWFIVFLPTIISFSFWIVVLLIMSLICLVLWLMDIRNDKKIQSNRWSEKWRE